MSKKKPKVPGKADLRRFPIHRKEVLEANAELDPNPKSALAWRMAAEGNRAERRRRFR
jgi:hypothetical protein